MLGPQGSLFVDFYSTKVSLQYKKLLGCHAVNPASVTSRVRTDLLFLLYMSLFPELLNSQPKQEIQFTGSACKF